MKKLKEGITKKIVYITGQTPYGLEESFITEEMLSIKKAGVNLLIIPRNPAKNMIDKEGNDLLENTLKLSLINFEITKYFFISLFKKPKNHRRNHNLGCHLSILSYLCSTFSEKDLGF